MATFLSSITIVLAVGLVIVSRLARRTRAEDIQALENVLTQQQNLLASIRQDREVEVLATVVKDITWLDATGKRNVVAGLPVAYPAANVGRIYGSAVYWRNVSSPRQRAASKRLLKVVQGISGLSPPILVDEPSWIAEAVTPETSEAATEEWVTGDTVH